MDGKSDFSKKAVKLKYCAEELRVQGAGGLEDLHHTVQIPATEPWRTVSASSAQHRGRYRTVSQRKKKGQLPEIGREGGDIKLPTV